MRFPKAGPVSPQSPTQLPIDHILNCGQRISSQHRDAGSAQLQLTRAGKGTQCSRTIYIYISSPSHPGHLGWGNQRTWHLRMDCAGLSDTDPVLEAGSGVKSHSALCPPRKWKAQPKQILAHTHGSRSTSHSDTDGQTRCGGYLHATTRTDLEQILFLSNVHYGKIQRLTTDTSRLGARGRRTLRSHH